MLGDDADTMVCDEEDAAVAAASVDIVRMDRGEGREIRISYNEETKHINSVEDK